MDDVFYCLQLTLMVMKPEVKDRVMSHEHPVSAAIYNSKFNQVCLDFGCLDLLTERPTDGD